MDTPKYLVVLFRWWDQFECCWLEENKKQDCLHTLIGCCHYFVFILISLYSKSTISVISVILLITLTFWKYLYFFFCSSQSSPVSAKVKRRRGRGLNLRESSAFEPIKNLFCEHIKSSLFFSLSLSLSIYLSLIRTHSLSLSLFPSLSIFLALCLSLLHYLTNRNVHKDWLSRGDLQVFFSAVSTGECS